MWTKRQVQIVEIVLRYPAGIKGSEIAKRLDVTARTVRNDVAAINTELCVLNCTLAARKQSGYHFDNESVPIVSSLLNHYKSVSQAETDDRRHSIFSALIFGGDTDLDDLADALYISPQTAYKDIAKIRRSAMTRFGKELFEQNSNMIIVCRDESMIRDYMLQLLQNESKNNADIYNSNMIRLIGGHYREEKLRHHSIVIKESFADKRIILSDELLFLILWAVHFAIIRNQTGHFLEETGEEMASGGGIIDAMKSISQELPEFTDRDIRFLDRFLWSLKLDESFNGSDAGESAYIIRDFCAEVNHKFGIDLKNSGELMKSLENHITFMIRRMQTGYEYENPIKGFIKDKYALSYEIAMLIVPIIYHYRRKYLEEGEVSYIAAYIEYYREEYMRVARVLLVNKSNSALAQIARNWLVQYFPNSIDVVGVIPFHLFDEYMQNHEADLVIALETPLRADIPVYVIDSLPQAEDRTRLQEIINSLKTGSRFENAVRNKFDPALFRYIERASTFEEIIWDAAARLEANGNIESAEEFAADILIRERNYPTLLSGSIMIPHPLNTFAIKSAVAAVVTRVPVECHGKHIRLILILATEAKFDPEIGDLFQVFNKIAESPQTTKHLASCKAFDDFMNAILRLIK